MKKYENPMLQIVSISEKDVIATSFRTLGNEYSSTDESYAPGQRGLDDWYAGY